jgi:hypothetical protein
MREVASITEKAGPENFVKKMTLKEGDNCNRQGGGNHTSDRTKEWSKQICEMTG